MGGKSKRQKALEAFAFSDPGWKATVLPISGNGGYAIVAGKVDSCTGKQMYGQQFAKYASKVVAEKLAADMNASKAELLAKAFP